jgi:tetratricopeptide (TPR) repeat protein
MKANRLRCTATTLAAFTVLCVPVAIAQGPRPSGPARGPENRVTESPVAAAEPTFVSDLVKRAEAVGANPSDILSASGIQMQRRGRLMEAIAMFRAALHRTPTDPVIQARLEAAERARLRAAEEFDRRADVALTELRFENAIREAQKALQLVLPAEPLYLRARAHLEAARERLGLAKPTARAVTSDPPRLAAAISSRREGKPGDGGKATKSRRRFAATKQSQPPPAPIEPEPREDILDLVNAALNGGEYDRAATLVEQALAAEPDRFDLPRLQERVSAERRRAAEDVAAAAAQRDESGDRRGALAAYALARTMDSALPSVDEAVERIRGSMEAAASLALTCAHVYEAKRRSRDAASCYERAIENLADDDPRRIQALRRLERLAERRDEQQQ